MEKSRENRMEVARAREKLSEEISRLVKSKNIYTNALNNLRKILKQRRIFVDYLTNLRIFTLEACLLERHYW
jgi:DNA primase